MTRKVSTRHLAVELTAITDAAGILETEVRDGGGQARIAEALERVAGLCQRARVYS